jgi:hypothetical protein
MSSDGGDPIDVRQVVNVATNFATLGLVGMDDNGNFGAGAVARAVDEGVGELTTRNLQRRALNEAEDRMAAEQAARAQEIADEREFARQQDVRASQQVAAIRRTAQSRQDAVLGFTGERDFLGL